MFEKLKCKVYDHDWKYNFSTMPNKAICTRCKIKSKFDLRELEWNPIDTFEGETRTDGELISAWVDMKQ
tara:strand:- start:11363 stop:11569 length:207 start_codon:yes stop_codon:yes gene_type:complete